MTNIKIFEDGDRMIVVFENATNETKKIIGDMVANVIGYQKITATSVEEVAPIKVEEDPIPNLPKEPVKEKSQDTEKVPVSKPVKESEPLNKPTPPTYSNDMNNWQFKFGEFKGKTVNDVLLEYGNDCLSKLFDSYTKMKGRYNKVAEYILNQCVNFIKEKVNVIESESEIITFCSQYSFILGEVLQTDYSNVEEFIMNESMDVIKEKLNKL